MWSGSVVAGTHERGGDGWVDGGECRQGVGIEDEELDRLFGDELRSRLGAE